LGRESHYTSFPLLLVVFKIYIIHCARKSYTYTLLLSKSSPRMVGVSPRLKIGQSSHEEKRRPSAMKYFMWYVQSLDLLKFYKEIYAEEWFLDTISSILLLEPTRSKYKK
jgi:hypothetical protein